LVRWNKSERGLTVVVFTGNRDSKRKKEGLDVDHWAKRAPGLMREKNNPWPKNGGLIDGKTPGAGPKRKSCCLQRGKSQLIVTE